VSTDADGRLVPSMARKWKQINKFVEVFDHAFATSALAAQDAPVRVVDFGSGKGYLTFALHDHLHRTLDRTAEMTGVELRTDLVELGNRAAERTGAEGLRFIAGDVRSHEPGPIDVMIALHACDTATDHALHLGLRGRRRDHPVLTVLPQAAAAADALTDAAAADAPARHPPRPAGRDGDRQPACAAARSRRLCDPGVRVRCARAHQQEQDDPRGEAAATRGSV
jgi:SAM-dependent methyltransferase